MTIDATCPACDLPFTFDPDDPTLFRVKQPANTNGTPTRPVDYHPPCPRCGHRTVVRRPPAAA